MRWIITGGCGFIGCQLVRNLLADGEQVLALDNLSGGSVDDLQSATTGHKMVSFNDWRNGASQLCFVEEDVRHVEVLKDLFDNIDVIVHLAANTGVVPSIEDPIYDCSVNVLGSVSVLHAAVTNRCSRVVFASSGAVVGNAEPPIHESMPTQPISPYGVSKLSGEAYCKAFHESYGQETVALRFGNVFGPGSRRKGSVVAKLIRESIAGESWEVYGTGHQTRDFIYVDDLIGAIRLAAIVDGIGGEVFQVATNQETSINDLVSLISVVLSEKHLRVPHTNFMDARAGEVMRNFSNTSKANAILGWAATTDLRQGLEKTIDWFRADFSK